MHPVVEVQQPNQAALFISVRGPLVLGRECDGLLLADRQVSRRHLLIDVIDGVVVVADLGSTNGSTIDGRPLDSPTRLLPGLVVRCGETTVSLEVDDTVGAGSADSTLVVGVAEIDPSRTVADRAPTPTRSGSIGNPRSFSSVRQSSIDIVAAKAQHDGVDVRSLPADQGTVTIVFSDIEASTERNVALGDQAWFEVLEVHNRTVEHRVTEFGGTIVKNQGDGFMLSFSGARRALDCMIAVQQDLVRGSNIAPDRSVRVRIGMHTGEVLADAGGDIFGQHVVVAARIADLAAGGEILVSSLTKEIIASRGDLRFGEPRAVTLKGIGDAIVYPMNWTPH